MGAETAYRDWMLGEGIPVVTGHSVADVRAVELAPWARTGGGGAFIDLHGMEGFTGMWLGEIPPRASLKPLQHMFEEYIYVLDGSGSAEVWLPGEDADSTRTIFEWQPGSLFIIPLNCLYRLHNGSSRRALYLSVSNAPLVMDLFRDEDFVFHNDRRFAGRFQPAPDFFAVTDQRMTDATGTVWQTNFIPDVAAAHVDPMERKGTEVRVTHFQMGGNALAGHLSAWPAGGYHKAHHHQGGAIILILRSEGYDLMWPQEAGVRPYEAGNGASVVRVPWGPGTVYSPPMKWFHQHFNVGQVPALQLAFHFGNRIHPVGFHRAASPLIGGVTAQFVSQRRGGHLIDYEDEDPRIRRDFEAARAEAARAGR